MPLDNIDERNASYATTVRGRQAKYNTVGANKPNMLAQVYENLEKPSNTFDKSDGHTRFSRGTMQFNKDSLSNSRKTNQQFMKDRA